MKKRNLLLIFGSLAILASMLACSIPVVPTAVPGGGDPGTGGDPVVVTDAPVVPVGPVAPPPLTVAYVRAGNVWVWTEVGGSRQLTFTGDAGGPSVSSDGQVVAFIRNGELWAVNADGTNERVLVDTAYLNTIVVPNADGDHAEVNQVVWYPDGGHMLYFNTLTVAGIIGYRIPRFDLYSVHADAPLGSAINVQPAEMGGIPYISPDRTVVALVQPTKVIFMAVDGSFYVEAFTFPMALTYSEWFYVPEVVWMPDSSGVRLVVPATDPLGDPTEVSTFWSVPVSGAPMALTTFLSVPVFSNFPYVSPNADSVLYLVETDGMAQIHSINSGGADTFYFWYDPNTVGVTGWAPDSVHFTFWNPAPVNAGYGASDTNMALGDSPMVRSIGWVDASRFFYLNGEELRLGSVGGASALVDSGVSDYEFVP